MAEPLRRTLECTSGSLEPFSAVGRDPRGRTLWTAREREGGGLARYTKFRAALRLVLELEGPQGRFLLERFPGLFRQRWQLLDPKGRVKGVFRPRSFRWEVSDCFQQPLGSARFSNFTLLGPDKGVLLDSHGLPLATFHLQPVSWLSSRFRAELELSADPQPWEPLAIALLTLRLAIKQGR